MTATTRAPTARAARAARAARVITELSTPAAVNTVTPLAIGAHGGSIAWGFVVSLCSGIIPMAYILRGVRSSAISDHHVTDRTRRPAVMAFILGSLVVGLSAEIVFDAPRDVIAPWPRCAGGARRGCRSSGCRSRRPTATARTPAPSSPGTPPARRAIGR